MRTVSMCGTARVKLLSRCQEPLSCERSCRKQLVSRFLKHIGMLNGLMESPI